MIYGAYSGTVYAQKKSLEYIDLLDSSFTRWKKLSQTIPMIIGDRQIKWTSPSVLVEWDNDL